MLLLLLQKIKSKSPVAPFIKGGKSRMLFPLPAPRSPLHQRMLRTLPGRRVKSMAKVMLASSLTRWLPEAQRGAQGELSLEVAGDTVDEVLNSLFLLHPSLRGYVLDEQGVVRHHVAVIVDGEAVRDKRNLVQPLGKHGELYIMQALSGG